MTIQADPVKRYFYSLSENRHYTLALPTKKPRDKIRAAKWCPKHDLLATIENKTLAVNRLTGDGQAAWHHKFDYNITQFCWHPNGKRIAVIGSKGQLTLHDGDRGQVMSKLSLVDSNNNEPNFEHDKDDRLDGGMVLMGWAEINLGTFKNQLRDVLDITSTKATDRNIVPEHNEKDFPVHQHPLLDTCEKSELDALFVFDKIRGNMWVALCGTFLLPMIELQPNNSSERNIEILDFSISPDLSTIHLYCCISSHDSKEASILIEKVETGLLSTRPHFLAQVSSMSSDINRLIQNINRTITSLVETFEGDCTQANSQMQLLQRKFKQILEDQGIGELTNPKTELMTLLATGRPSDFCTEFILSAASKKIFRQWEKLYEHSLTLIKTRYYEVLLPNLERLIARLTHLLMVTTSSRDVSHTNTQLCGNLKSDGNKCIGQVWNIQSSYEFMEQLADPTLMTIVLAGHFLALVTQSSVSIEKVVSNYRSFTAWYKYICKDVQWQNDQALNREDDDYDEEDETKKRPLTILGTNVKFRTISQFIRFNFEDEPQNYLETSNVKPKRDERARNQYSLDELAAYLSNSDYDSNGFSEAINGLLSTQKVNCSQHGFSQRIDNTNVTPKSSGLLFIKPTDDDDEIPAGNKRAGNSQPKIKPLGFMMLTKELDQRANGIFRSMAKGAMSRFSFGNRLQLGCNLNAVSESRGQAPAIICRGLTTIAKDPQIQQQGYVLANVHSVSQIEIIYWKVLRGGEKAIDKRIISVVDLAKSGLKASNINNSEVDDVSVIDLQLFDKNNAVAILCISSVSQSTGDKQSTEKYYIVAFDYTIDASDFESTIRLRELNTSRRYDTGSGDSLALTCNGEKGRRIMAVVETRGSKWWPFDFDNDEDEEEDEEDEDEDL